MEPKKHNISLIIGIAIPVAMILFVAASIYLPGLFTQPHYGFVYAVGDTNYYSGDQVMASGQTYYMVEGGHLVKKVAPTSTAEMNPAYPVPVKPVVSEVKFYVYDIEKNESREVSFDEAQKYKLDSEPVSPDGFEIVQGGYGGGFFPFFGGGGDYNSTYIKGHNVSRKLNIRGVGSSYPYYGGPYGFRFLGWIE